MMQYDINNKYASSLWDPRDCIASYIYRHLSTSLDCDGNDITTSTQHM